jgi:hypothetical protein
MNSDDEGDEPISKQIINMILDNNAVRAAYPWITGYVVFNVIILSLLIYISIRISIR